MYRMNTTISEKGLLLNVERYMKGRELTKKNLMWSIDQMANRVSGGIVKFILILTDSNISTRVTVF